MDNDLQKRIADLESVVYNHTHRGYDMTPPLPNTALDTKDFVADTTISVNAPVRVEISTINHQTTSSNQLNNDIIAGDGTSPSLNERVAVQFIVGSTDVVMNRVTWWLKKQNSPTDNYSVYMCADNAGVPQNTALGTSANVDASTVSTTSSFVTFDFATPLQLTAGSTYWAVLKRSAAQDSTNALTTDDNNTASATQAKRRNGIWTTSFSSMDTTIEYYDGANPGRILLASSLDVYRKRVIGFAKNGGSQGSNIVVKLLGVMDSFSSLTTGYPYYLKDDSTVGTTPGTLTVPVGYAVSSTELDIIISV